VTGGDKASTITLCDAAIEFGSYLQSQADELLLGALIEVEGPVRPLDHFLPELVTNPPLLARIEQ
jgi:hypothetical protein